MMARRSWREDLRWFLTWCVSPAPLGWLLLGMLGYALVDEINDALTIGSVAAEGRQLRRKSDSLQAVLDSGKCVFYAPPTNPAQNAAQDSVRAGGRR